MLYLESSLRRWEKMKSKQSKPREVREEIGAKGRVIINIYLSILPFLPSLPSILPSCVRRIFLLDIYQNIPQNNFSTLPPICFFKGSKGRVAKWSFIDSVFTLPLSLNFKGRVREELRKEWRGDL
jgi:hypothetical protein